MRKIVFLLALISFSALSQNNTAPFPKGISTPSVWAYATKIGFNTSTPQAAFDFVSTTGGIAPPAVTTTQKNAITTDRAGSIVYDTTQGGHYFWTGSVWERLKQIYSLQQILDVNNTANQTLSLTVTDFSNTFFKTTLEPYGMSWNKSTGGADNGFRNGFRFPTTTANGYYTFPAISTNRNVPISVNGNFAASNGDITLAIPDTSGFVTNPLSDDLQTDGYAIQILDNNEPIVKNSAGNLLFNVGTNNQPQAYDGANQISQDFGNRILYDNDDNQVFDYQSSIFFKDTGFSGRNITSVNDIGSTTYNGYVPENSANKQNSLTADGTNQKYPTVTAVNAGFSGKQPLNASLTSISGQANTTYGLALLTLANAASARTYIGAGTGSGSVTQMQPGNGVTWTNDTTTPTPILGNITPTAVTSSGNISTGGSFNFGSNFFAGTSSGNVYFQPSGSGSFIYNNPLGTVQISVLSPTGNYNAIGTGTFGGLLSGADVNVSASTSPTYFFGSSASISRSGSAQISFGNGTRNNASAQLLFGSGVATGTFQSSNIAAGATLSGSSSGTNTGDQTSVSGNAGTATALQTTRTIGAATGDVMSAGSNFDGTANNTNAYTLAVVNSNVGTFGSTTAVPVVTVNAKGLVTSISTATISSSSSVTKMMKLGAGDALTTFGDSFTAGSGATTTALGYSRRISERTGIVHDNLGASGSGVVEGFKRTNTASSYRTLVNNTTKSTIMYGFNDHIRGGADPRELAKIENGYMAMFSSMYAATAVAANDASVTQTGTWTSFTPSAFPVKATTLGGLPLSNTTSGNKLSYTFTGTSLVIGYTCNDATATGVTFSSFNVVIDGTTVATVSTNDKSLAVTDSYWNNQYAPAAVIYKNLGAGSHTVEIVNQSNNLLYIDWVGTLMPPTAAADILVGSIPYTNATGYATQPTYSPTTATSLQATNAIKNAINAFSDYPISFVEVNDFYSIITGVSADNIHPNDLGHSQIADAFMSRITNNAVSPLVTGADQQTAPKTLVAANLRYQNGTIKRDRTGIWGAGFYFDTNASTTLAGGFALANNSTGTVTNPLKITKTGNFGINTTSDPAYKLEVTGTTGFTGDMTITGNLLNDLSIAKSVPKFIFNNNVATISTAFSLVGNNSYARMQLRPETTTKAQGFFVCPNGTPSEVSSAKALIGVFSTDYGASTANYDNIYLQAGTFTGLNATSLGTGTLQPIKIGHNGTAEFTMSTSGVGSFVNPLTVPNAVSNSDAVNLGQLNAQTFTWSNVTTTTKAMVAQQGYVSTSTGGTQLVYTLPATATVGQIFAICGVGSGGWRINQNAGQVIKSSGNTTTTGTAGFITSGTINDCVELICVTANSQWNVRSAQGTLNLN